MAGNEDDEQAAKQNRWGSLAARLEVQCEDVLSMETEGAVSSSIRERLPSHQNGDTTGPLVSNGGAINESMLPTLGLRRASSAHSAAMSLGSAPSSHPISGEAGGATTNPSPAPYQHQLHQNELLLQPDSEGFQSHEPSNTGTKKSVAALKDWIVTKKVEKDIQKATSSLSLTSNKSAGISPYEKQHIEKCVKISHLLVSHLAKSFEGKEKKGSTGEGVVPVNGFDDDVGTDDWEPKPQDIDEDCITVTENSQTGAIIDVGFDIYRNFDWDQDEAELDENISSSPGEKLGLIFEALGKLLYKLFMEGEDVPPCPTSADTPLFDSFGEGERIDIPNEDDILDMLRKLPKTGASGENGKTDRITSSMRNSGHLPMPICRLVTDIFHTSMIMKGNTGQGGSQGNKDTGSCFGSLSDVHADLQQIIDFPEAFLFQSITSRWELIFGNNHMFGRKKELQQLMDASYRIQMSTNQGAIAQKKEAVMVSGHAGSGKSRLVREIRKPLQAQGWLFLRCKFGKTIQAEPLSVIALGLDEYFSSSIVCSIPAPGSQEALMGPPPNSCTCVNSNCPRKVCQRLESLIGKDGLKCLSQQMPSLCSLIGETYARDSLSNFNGLQGKAHTHHLFGTLLDTLISFSPVLFFVDDLQWADIASLELLTGLINRPVINFNGGSSTNRILFVGAYRTENMVEGQPLRKMIQEFEGSDTINTTQVSLHGFQLESLNEMVSEALCLPRRKTSSLSQIIYLKTQGFPLFVVEFLDALWTEKLLVNNPATGWEWDVDAIDLKGISKSVAELLACKLKRLPPDVLSGIQVLSCFGSHVDFDIIDSVKNYDGSPGATMLPALHTAQEEGLIEKAGPTFTFSHHLIQQAAFELIPVRNRIALLQKLVSCLIPSCMQEGGSDSFLFVTVDLINRIGSDAVFNNPVQSQLFARLNLEAGKKYMAFTDFSSAVKHFKSGITFLGANYFEDQYELSLSLFENSALASYSEGNHEQVAIQVNHVLSNAKSFEDKFKSYCVFINVIAIGSIDRATEKIYDLLRPLGENIDPSVISPQMALSEFMSTRGTLSGAKKEIFQHLFQMTDRTKLMAMKLMSMLVVYYNQQKTFMSGYLVCKMIRITLQYGHCEDTVFALSTFAYTLGNRLLDIDESYAVAQTALSLVKFYNADQLIPRVYGSIYGMVLVSKDPIQSTLDPLLKACRLAFSNGYIEHAVVNTIVYMTRSWQAGKKINLIQHELNAFAHQHKQQSHMSILQLFLAPTYKFLSALSGVTMDASELLTQLSAACNDDIVEAAKVKNENLFVQAAISLTIVEAFYMRDFVKASQVILNNPECFQSIHEKQMKITEFEINFHVGLISFHMARETREAHWMEKATIVLATFEKWSKMNKWNFESQYLILKAELHHTKGETNAAVQTYDLAAEAAQKHRFIHLVALACELAAHYFGNIGAKEKTREMIQKSHDAYMGWGAARKAKAVINLLELKWLE